jgi:hypothetical protein
MGQPKLHVSPRQFQRMLDAAARDEPIPLLGWYEGITSEEVERLKGTPFMPEIKVIVDWESPD